MVKLKRSQISTVSQAMDYPKGRGYVLDFSDRTIAEFFEDEFGIDFYDEKYRKNGYSKGKRLSAFIEIEDARMVANVLRALWDRREGLIARQGIRTLDEAEEAILKRKFMAIVAEVDGSSELPRTDALERFESGRTLDELIQDIDRDLVADKAEAALDRLHTYCVKKFRHLLKTRGLGVDQEEPLHSLVGKYRKSLEKERPLHQFTDRSLKSAISLFESFNDVRNNHSLAHDRPILEPAEARYIFDTVSAVLIFVRTLEAGRYEE